jgi:hypothetical protein
MKSIVICAVICVAGCGQPASSRASEPAAANADVAGSSAAPVDHHAATAIPDAALIPSAPAPFHPDDDPACASLAKLISAIRAWHVAANPGPHRDSAGALWPTLPTNCRGGTFFLAAAELVDQTGNAKLSTADRAVDVHSPADALARGLAAEPDHPALLAHLVFAADLVPDQALALPDNACARAKARGGVAWTDYVAYICALAAIHARDGATALSELDSIRSVSPFPDLTARRAQALAFVGKRREARALAKPAIAALARAWRFDMTGATREALKKKLAAL